MWNPSPAVQYIEEHYADSYRMQRRRGFSGPLMTGW